MKSNISLCETWRALTQIFNFNRYKALLTQNLLTWRALTRYLNTCSSLRPCSSLYVFSSLYFFSSSLLLPPFLLGAVHGGGDLRRARVRRRVGAPRAAERCGAGGVPFGVRRGGGGAGGTERHPRLRGAVRGGLRAAGEIQRTYLFIWF